MANPIAHSCIDTHQILACEPSTAVTNIFLAIFMIASLGLGLYGMNIVRRSNLPAGFTVGLIVTLAVDFIGVWPAIAMMTRDWAACTTRTGLDYVNIITRSLPTTMLCLSFFHLFAISALLATVISGFVFIRWGKMVSGVVMGIIMVVLGVVSFAFAVPKALMETVERVETCRGGTYRLMVPTQLANTPGMQAYHIIHDILAYIIPALVTLAMAIVLFVFQNRGKTEAYEKINTSTTDDETSGIIPVVSGIVKWTVVVSSVLLWVSTGIALAEYANLGGYAGFIGSVILGNVAVTGWFTFLAWVVLGMREDIKDA